MIGKLFFQSTNASSDRYLANKIALLTTYLMLPVVIYSKNYVFERIFSSKFENPIWPVSWLENFKFTDKPFTVISFYLICLSIPIATSAYTHSRLMRLICFFVLFMFFSIEDSFVKISHSEHTTIFILFSFIFLPEWNKRTKPNKKYKLIFNQVFFYTQILVTLPYFLSGTQRFALYLLCESDKCVSFSETISAWIKLHELFNASYGKFTYYLQILSPTLSATLVLLVTLLEVSSPIFVLIGKSHIIGILLILFHGINLIFLNVAFTTSLIPLICVLILPNLVFDVLKKQSST